MTLYETPEGRYPSELMIDGELVKVPSGIVQQGSEPNGGNCLGFFWIKGRGVIIDTKNPEGDPLVISGQGLREFLSVIGDPSFAAPE